MFSAAKLHKNSITAKFSHTFLHKKSRQAHSPAGHVDESAHKKGVSYLKVSANTKKS